jgi:26 proteasome complex subunit DSS1
MASTDNKPDDKLATHQEQKNEDKEKVAIALGEDDEFEDFPVDNWPIEQTEAAQGSDTKHLWEESWDDDDTNDDFSQQLKEELKKVEAAKRK